MMPLSGALSGPPSLSLLTLSIAAGLLLLQAAVSLAFRLGLEKTLAIAALRMTAQLALIGFVLKLVFEQASPVWTGLLAAVMMAAAAWEIAARQGARFRGLLVHGLSGGLMLLAGGLTTVLAAGVLLGGEPWYSPRVVLPILGMILGNAMTGVALTLDSLTHAARREQAGIEARIALGQPRLEAFAAPLRQALRTGLMPIINAMAAAGIVSLPGMMTGQILSGVDPVEAAKYQLLIMFLISGATALGVVGAGLGGVHLLTDARHRLRLDRLQDGDG
jgi:putative ABC transport system permease protein